MVQTCQAKGEHVKAVFRKHRYSWFAIFCLAAALAIVVCNLWLLCCGQWVLNDYLRIPALGWTILVANLVAGLVLVAVRGRRKTAPAGGCCENCRIGLREEWVYCPNCGRVCGG